jgi:excisionase family DNA binding protein
MTLPQQVIVRPAPRIRFADPPQPFFTIEQVAQAIGRKVPTVRFYAQVAKVPAIKLGKRLLFPVLPDRCPSRFHCYVHDAGPCTSYFDGEPLSPIYTNPIDKALGVNRYARTRRTTMDAENAPSGEPRVEELEPYLTVQQVAHWLNLPPSTVSNYARQGLLPSVQIGKRRIFSVPVLKRFLASKQTGCVWSGMRKATRRTAPLGR